MTAVPDAFASNWPPKIPPPGYEHRTFVPATDFDRVRAAIRTDVEVVTPERAAKWLAENNKINRNIRQKVVDRYAEQMADGLFPNTGESIIFDWNGQLVSGQHRLLAVVQSGVTLSMVVVRGVDPDVRDVVDTGVKRTMADTLKLHGEVNCHVLANALGWLWRYQNGKMRWPQSHPSNAGSLALLAEHPGIRETVKLGGRLRQNPGGSPGLYAALFYVFGGIDCDTANEFAGQLLQGTLLMPGDPSYAFRRLMQNTKPNRRLDQVYVAALLIKSWNFVRAGKQVQTLIWRPTSGEPFPVAK